MRLALESGDVGKQIAFPGVGGHHPIHGESESNKRHKEEEFTPFFLPHSLN